MLTGVEFTAENQIAQRFGTIKGLQKLCICAWSWKAFHDEDYLAIWLKGSEPIQAPQVCTSLCTTMSRVQVLSIVCCIVSWDCCGQDLVISHCYIYIYYIFLNTPKKLCTCHLKPACSWVFPYFFAVLVQGQNPKNPFFGGLEDDFQNWMMFRFQLLIFNGVGLPGFVSLQIFCLTPPKPMKNSHGNMGLPAKMALVTPSLMRRAVLPRTNCGELRMSQLKVTQMLNYHGNPLFLWGFETFIFLGFGVQGYWLIVGLGVWFKIPANNPLHKGIPGIQTHRPKPTISNESWDAPCMKKISHLKFNSNIPWKVTGTH